MFLCEIWDLFDGILETFWGIAGDFGLPGVQEAIESFSIFVNDLLGCN